MTAAVATFAPGRARTEAPGAVTLSVPGLRCAGCMRRVEETLTALPGVADARVNLTMKRVTVVTDLPAEALVQALGAAGHEAYAFDPSQAEAATDAIGRDLILRLGVAGFAMMNVMLLSVAVWSGAGDATRDLFHLISAAIALPATVFSARPFFVSAWGALRVGRLNMDVPISLAILLAAGMSLFEALNSGAHAYFDAALSLTFFLLIGRVLEHRTRAAARTAAQDLAALEVQAAQRKRGATFETVPVAHLAVGDVVLVPTGMRVPVDGVLMSAAALTDRAFLTGESAPVTSETGAALRAGEINVGAPLELRTTAVGDDTALRQMARLVETAETARTRYTSLADRAARIYAPAVHILAAVAFLGWWLATGDVRHALNIAIAVLIITCPCALGLAVPAVATAAMGKLYRMGFLVKSGTALERLAECDTVLFDKTGTLTEPGAVVATETLGPREQTVALALAQVSGHPISRALVQALEGVAPAPLTDLTETPGQGVTACLDGRPVALGRADWLGGTGRGLALKLDGEVHPIAYGETLRAGTEALIPALTAQGHGVEMLSGDTAAKARVLAERLGIARWHGDMTPADKHDTVRAMQADGQRVCMVGDGINDTAALAKAHASVAPGTALDAARNAADVVVLRRSLDRLPDLFRTAQMSVRLSRENFAIAALYNLVAVPVALAGFASPMLAALAMSTSSLTVLLNAMRVRWSR